MPGGKMGATTIPIKWILKKYYDWEHKSYNEQIIIKYRIKNVLATILCLLPLTIGMLFTFFGSDKGMRGGASLWRELREVPSALPLSVNQVPRDRYWWLWVRSRRGVSA